MNISKELAEAHFEGYIKPLLEVHGTTEDDLKIISFHYKSAFIHGFKHGIESVKEIEIKVLTD